MKSLSLASILIFVLFMITEQIKISSSTFKKTSGQSVSLTSSNSALIQIIDINSNKSKKYCIRLCQIDSNCAALSIAWNNMTCYLFNVGVTSQTRLTASQVDMFKKSPNDKTSLNTNGLINYWPIHNDFKDYIGNAHLTPEITNIAFANDRFNNENESLSFVKNGYYALPSGVYASGDFTLIAWVRVIQTGGDSKIMDFGNYGPTDDLEFSLSTDTTGKPYIAYNTNSGFCKSESSTAIPLYEWHHLAAVLNGFNQSLYMNGVIVGSSICSPQCIPTQVTREYCKIGRSNYPNNDDAYADFDELKIYSRALNDEEILYDMDYSHH